MPVVIENAGSNARDFCMLERNLLAALKLAALLCVLFASILLRGRLRISSALDDNTGVDPNEGKGAAFTMAGLEFGAAIIVIGAAVQEYHSGVRDLRGQRAFLRSESIHLALMAAVSVIVLGTCLTLLVAPSLV